MTATLDKQRPGAGRSAELDVWLQGLERAILTPKEHRERVLTRPEALDWLYCAPAVFDALVAAGLPQVGVDHATDEPLYDFYDVVNVGLAAGTGTTTGELGQWALLRYARSSPEKWITPRGWSVGFDYRCDGGAGCVDGTWEVAATALAEFGGRLKAAAITVEPGGHAVSVHVRCEVRGRRRTVASPSVREAYAEAVEALRSGRRQFHWLPSGLRRDPRWALSAGLGDCVVVSAELSQELARAGYESRTRTVTALAATGIDHAWTEVRDSDGEWKILDPLFAYLALQLPGTDPVYEEFCCGSVSNRVLPWSASALAGVAHHTCRQATSIVSSTITTGVLRHATS